MFYLLDHLDKIWPMIASSHINFLSKCFAKWQITMLSATLIASLNSCNIASDQGLSNMNRVHHDQVDGKQSTDDYEIINITQNNYRKYNKQAKSKHGQIPPLQKSKTYSDVVRPYDKLTVLVIDSAEEGAFASSRGPTTFGPLEVPSNGIINVPYAGEIKATGKSITGIQNEIKERYSTKFNTAEISLNRVSRQSLTASVLGLTRSPSQHPITRQGMTLAELISLSGGTTEEPYLCEYHLHRNGHTYILSNDQITKLNLKTQDGDLIEVKRSGEHSITMMGSVRRPGNHKFPKAECHLTDFLGSGSGININQADATGVFLFRKIGSKTHIYRFNIKKPEGLILASKFHVLGKDIIYVTEAPLSKWGRVLRDALPFGQLQSAASVGL